MNRYIFNFNVLTKSYFFFVKLLRQQIEKPQPYSLKQKQQFKFQLNRTLNNQLILINPAEPFTRCRNKKYKDNKSLFLKKLGEGAYSTVYKVRRKIDAQLYALKKVKMKHLSTKEKQNSLNEVRILASILHPNVISYKEAFFQAQSLYIVMEFADNGDLLAEINLKKKKDEIYNEDELWSVFYQMCAGLNELHKLKIIHRDIKSANLFLTKDRQVKLGDMNVSKVGDLLTTQTGTPYYASPEVWKDLPYDSKSDIWSLGCVLYEMITLSPPFKGIDMEDLYQSVVMGAFEPIPSSYSLNLKLMIDSLLQKTPVKRPSTTYILENIEQFVPVEYHSNSFIAEMIKKYSKKNRNLKKRENGRVNQLMKTIQFPIRKKNKKLADYDLSSVLPSPSYSKSHRTTEQKSLKKAKNHQSIFQGQKQKLKPQALLMPRVNISLHHKSNKRKKVQQKEKARYKLKNDKENQNYQLNDISKSLIAEKNVRIYQKDNQRLVLPAIQNKRINYRR